MKPKISLILKRINMIDNDRMQSRVRILFWIVGPLAAGALTYTTRYFINGDAMTYIEIGESFINGRFSALINLTYSPVYPVLLGLTQSVLNTNPLNEIQALKIVNFFCFLLAMAGCDSLLSVIRKELRKSGRTEEAPAPMWIFNALCYSMFLVSALALVRLRLLNPDMLIFALILIITAIMLRIREYPEAYGSYAALGVTTGIGYLSKSFFLVFSPILFLLAAACSVSLKRALPRLLVAVLLLLVLSAPFMTALSHRLGRFTYGELGKHVYALWISGKGDPIYPKVIHEYPKTILYRYDVPCTRPSGFDNCYWYEGFKPVFNLSVHVPIIAKNVVSVFLQAPWLLLIGIWYVLQWRLGHIRIGPLRPPSVFVVLSTISIAGIGLYCLLNVELRYVASFLFLGFVALAMSVKYSEQKPGSRVLMLGSSVALILFLLGLAGYSIVEQSYRSVRSEGGKLSYKQAFLEHIAVKDFLQKHGIGQGDEIAILGSPPVNWARMAGVRIVAEIPNADQMISASTEQKDAALAVLRKQGIKAIVAKDDSLNNHSSPAWKPIPGTRDYFILRL